MRYIGYTTNWNNKLACKIHTTIRRHDPNLHEGMDVEERLNGKFLNNSEIMGIVNMELGCLPRLTVMQDTGYGYDESIEIFRRFFKAATIAKALVTDVDLIYLRKIK